MNAQIRKLLRQIGDKIAEFDGKLLRGSLDGTTLEERMVSYRTMVNTRAELLRFAEEAQKILGGESEEDETLEEMK